MPDNYFRQRYQCKNCGNYMDIFSNNLATIADFYCNRCHIQGQWKEVPRWYGQKVPNYLAVVAINFGRVGEFAIIPEFYIEKCIYLAGLNGQTLSKDDAVDKFRKSTKSAGLLGIMVVENEWWFKKIGWMLEANHEHPNYKLHKIIKWQG